MPEENETSPLLRRGSSSTPTPSGSSSSKSATSTATSDTAERKPSKGWLFARLPSFTTIHSRYRFVPLLGCTLIFTNEAEYFIKQVASMRALEAMHCYNYYLELNSPLVELGKHIPERLCKIDTVQKQLARSAGLIMFVRMLSAMLGAIPLGWVADRAGRKVVLVLHKVNVTIACGLWLCLYLGFPKVPIWTLYLSGLPGVIGGNFDVGLSMLFASYTDVMPVATERASLFFLTTSMQYLAQTFSPSIGAFLMNLDGKGGTPQVNLAVSFAIAVLTALITIFLFPETVGESRKHAASLAQQSTSPSSSSPTIAPDDPKLNPPSTSTPLFGLGLPNLILLFTSIFVAATGIKSIDFFGLIQYPVIKFAWTFPQASYIVATQGFLMLLHFSLLLPLLNTLAARWLRSTAAGHFAIMLASAAILALGSVVIGASDSGPVFVGGVVVYLFGEGLPTATQAYIVSLVEKGRVARVMATLSMASIGGKLVASIAFPEVLAWGLDSGRRALVGLPFFVAAGLFAVSAGCVGTVGVRVGVGRGRKGKGVEEV
ncbi:uncharacterized protein BDZ99DRAFT_494653 [Mytilinidion resinicola]|uniref:MFS general substrate transporter n=1 Tax=Mytilinidion resinicola TaxID=574789 RepID=A0A6A6Z3K0_9PEZI|nr:uncharacterized protein BDZ99DRAFT_494653 [Mytilinidion resinicola]KAF2814735.1 hypothetical protein BDZ99DRAFT_494653 [Mytilinidion resinicola]